MNNLLAALAGNQALYFLIVVGIFAIGDFFGVFSKAKVSSVFVTLLIFLVGFMTNIIPKDIIELAGITGIAKISAALIIFHMGTMINLKQLRAEWRTVVTAVLSMIVVAVSLLLVIPIIGYENVIVSIPVINGGLISTKIMVEAATTAGFPIAAALATVLYAVQKFAGAYPASFFGMKEAKLVLEDVRLGKQVLKTETKAVIEEKETFFTKNQKYFTDFTCIALAAFFSWLAGVLDALTGINYSIWALLSGATLGYLGFVPTKILERGKASGLLSMLVFAAIIPSLAKIEFSDLSSLGFSALVVLGASLLGLFLVFYVLPGWKISKSKNLALGIAMGQMLGFPATFLISNEIAVAMTDNKEEQDAILERIMPAYVVAGLVTVTTLSIIIAGIFATFI